MVLLFTRKMYIDGEMTAYLLYQESALVIISWYQQNKLGSEPFFLYISNELI